MATLRNLIPLQSIGVRRGDQTIYPPIGKVFGFTGEEAEELMKQVPGRRPVVRMPRNEAPEELAGPTGPSGEVKDAAAKPNADDL